MKIKEILEGISFYKIPELKPDEVIVLSTSTLIEQHQFEVIKEEINKGSTEANSNLNYLNTL